MTGMNGRRAAHPAQYSGTAIWPSGRTKHLQSVENVLFLCAMSRMPARYWFWFYGYRKQPAEAWART
jgi:hypothetical protein